MVQSHQNFLQKARDRNAILVTFFLWFLVQKWSRTAQSNVVTGASSQTLRACSSASCASGGHQSQVKIADDIGQTRGFVRYWSTKASNPALHDGELGGARNPIFTEEGQTLVEEMLFNELHRDCTRTCRAFAQVLTERGFEVDSRFRWAHIVPSN